MAMGRKGLWSEVIGYRRAGGACSKFCSPPEADPAPREILVNVFTPTSRVRRDTKIRPARIVFE